MEMNGQWVTVGSLSVDDDDVTILRGAFSLPSSVTHIRSVEVLIMRPKMGLHHKKRGEEMHKSKTTFVIFLVALFWFSCLKIDLRK